MSQHVKTKRQARQTKKRCIQLVRVNCELFYLNKLLENLRYFHVFVG
jgi:hypothetical protein